VLSSSGVKGGRRSLTSLDRFRYDILVHFVLPALAQQRLAGILLPATPELTLTRFTQPLPQAFVA
jgi:hypothetical protein